MAPRQTGKTARAIDATARGVVAGEDVVIITRSHQEAERLRRLLAAKLRELGHDAKRTTLRRAVTTVGDASQGSLRGRSPTTFNDYGG